MNASERRFQLLSALLKRRKESMESLALEFHVSYMTIFRDIQLLSCYYPIITKRGTNGGVFIMDGYCLGTTYLTVPQTLLLERLSALLTGEELMLMQEIIKTFSKPDSVK